MDRRTPLPVTITEEQLKSIAQANRAELQHNQITTAAIGGELEGTNDPRGIKGLRPNAISAQVQRGYRVRL